MFCSLLPWKWAVEGLCVVAGKPNYLRVRQAVRVVPVTVGPVEKAHTLLQQPLFLYGLGLYAFVLGWCLLLCILEVFTVCLSQWAEDGTDKK